MLAELTMFGRFTWGLRRFLRTRLSLEQARAMVRSRLGDREQNFLRVAQRGIYDQLDSPYRKLLLRAGIQFDDLVRMVQNDGLETTLVRLYEVGVYVTLEEFKARRAIERAGEFKLPVEPRDFDNPLPARHYEATSGGSRSAGTRIVVDLDLLSYEAAYHLIYRDAFGLLDRPMALWRPLPPGSAGIKNALYQLKTSGRLERWFHPNRQTLDPRLLKYRVFTAAAVYGSRLFGTPLPVPRYVPLDRAVIVARWLADVKARGTPGLLDGTASSAVRTCLAAQRHGIDIAGSVFRVGGEPWTAAKARAIADAGCTATPHFSMSEVGRIGMGCAAPSALDDMHVMLDKFALITRPRELRVGGNGAGASVPALFLTTLHPSSPKLMLNVETDDYAQLEHRACCCPIGALGLGLHLHTLRSYDKLSSEGMSFIGSHLIDLLEHVLPARFGGSATDYQFVEEEEAGLPRVRLLVSPRVGPLDVYEVVTTVLGELGRHSGGTQMMAQVWRSGGTLRVVRAEPHVTAGAKILPLHINRDGIGVKA